LIGKAPAQEVVQSVMQAERSLHLAIAVRDKLVAAWQDVSRMSI
jgi:flagellar hook-basal body complex protein FliE